MGKLIETIRSVGRIVYLLSDIDTRLIELEAKMDTLERDISLVSGQVSVLLHGERRKCDVTRDSVRQTANL